MTCHAVACPETVQIAQLVARQRSSKKKTGRQVNCQMRLKNTSPVALVGKPQTAVKGLPLPKGWAAAEAKVFSLRCITESHELHGLTGRFQVVGSGANRGCLCLQAKVCEERLLQHAQDLDILEKTLWKVAWFHFQLVKLLWEMWVSGVVVRA